MSNARGKAKVTFVGMTNYKGEFTGWGLYPSDAIPHYILASAAVALSFKMKDVKSQDELMNLPECRQVIESHERWKAEEEAWQAAHYTPWEVDVYDDEVSPSLRQRINAMVKAGHIKAEWFSGMRCWTLKEATKQGREWLCELSFSLEP